MGMDSKPILRSEYFYKFFQCPHWIWYDIYGDGQHKRDVPPLLDLIYKGKMVRADQDLVVHKKFEQINPEQFKDLDEAFLATLELMKKGKNIYHGVLMSEDWVGMPDLLEARPGKSWLGDWHYVVYDAQNSLALGDEYKSFSTASFSNASRAFGPRKHLSSIRKGTNGHLRSANSLTSFISPVFKSKKFSTAKSRRHF